METEILSDSVPKHSARAGLSDQEVARLRAEHGWNELPKPRKVSPVTVFLRQFTSFLVVILIVAAGIAFFLGERIDTLAI
ncbi:MAG: hypothetical protein HKP40_00685, partial [Litoreibacter sp.]|nr:hypothetical protein [Litoreibacter sp.]